MRSKQERKETQDQEDRAPSEEKIRSSRMAAGRQRAPRQSLELGVTTGERFKKKKNRQV